MSTHGMDIARVRRGYL